MEEQTLKKRKILVGVLISVISLTLICFAVGFVGINTIRYKILDFFGISDDTMTYSDRIKEVINTTHPTDIIILGDDISFEVDINFRKIEKLSQDVLERKSEYKYTVLIVNDLNNNVQLTEEERNLLNQKIKEQGFCLMYLGEKYSSTWDDKNQAIANVEGNLFYGYYSVSGTPKRNVGAWMVEYQEQLETYPNSLGETILYSIESFLREIG